MSFNKISICCSGARFILQRTTIYALLVECFMRNIFFGQVVQKETSFHARILKVLSEGVKLFFKFKTKRI